MLHLTLNELQALFGLPASLPYEPRHGDINVEFLRVRAAALRERAAALKRQA